MSTLTRTEKKTLRSYRERKFTRKAIVKDFKHNKWKYLMVVPLLAFFIIFSYIPMYGLVMAFCDYKPKLGIMGSLINNFVGFENFTNFFNGIYFWRLLRNTLVVSVLDLVVSFPLTILVALLLNEVKNRAFKKTVATLTYMPYFISMVVVCGLVVDFCRSDGVLGSLVGQITGTPQNLLGVSAYWWPIYIGSNLWQGLGFGTIIYTAALSGVDQELYEAASMDGAGHMKQLWHVTLPGILPTIIIMLIMRVGSLMASGYEKVILMYNPQIYNVADVIGSYVYRRGLVEGDYSFSTAVGLFNSVINLILIVITNKISKKYSEISLF